MEESHTDVRKGSRVSKDVFQSQSPDPLTIVMRKAHELYGDPLPTQVNDRLVWELNAVRANEYASRFMAVSRIAQKMRDTGFTLRGWGTGDVSITGMLCGVSEINPLPPHYRCPHCQHSAFDVPKTILSGYDLPQKRCPICGTTMCSDGQTIPAELCFGVNGDMPPHFVWACSSEGIEWLQKQAEALHTEGTLFQVIDGCIISDLLEIVPDWHEALLQKLQKQVGLQSIPLDIATREVLHSGKCTTDPKCAEILYGGLPHEESRTTFGEVIWETSVSHLQPEGRWALQALRQDGKDISEIPFCRENAFLQLSEFGLSQSEAMQILNTAIDYRRATIHSSDIQMMKGVGVPAWHLDTLPFLRNLWRKAHSVSSLQTVLKILYQHETNAPKGSAV